MCYEKRELVGLNTFIFQICDAFQKVLFIIKIYKEWLVLMTLNQ